MASAGGENFFRASAILLDLWGGEGGEGREEIGGEGCDGGVHSTLSAALSIAVYSHFTVWSPVHTLHTAIIVTKVLEQRSFTWISVAYIYIYIYIIYILYIYIYIYYMYIYVHCNLHCTYIYTYVRMWHQRLYWSNTTIA